MNDNYEMTEADWIDALNDEKRIVKDLEKKLAEANARIVEKTLDAQSEEKWASTYKKQRDEFEKKLAIAVNALNTLRGTDLTDMQLIMIRYCLNKLNQ